MIHAELRARSSLASTIAVSSRRKSRAGSSFFTSATHPPCFPSVPFSWKTLVAALLFSAKRESHIDGLRSIVMLRTTYRGESYVKCVARTIYGRSRRGFPVGCAFRRKPLVGTFRCTDATVRKPVAQIRTRCVSEY